MRAAIKRMNAWFITFVLFFVYFIGVGLARLAYMITLQKKYKESSSYWKSLRSAPGSQFTTPY